MRKVFHIQTEDFPVSPGSEWQPLFDAEGVEIRGYPMNFDWNRYKHMQLDGRLIFVTARYDGYPAGYCSGYVFRDLHWETRNGCDDIWFVKQEHRCQGLGHDMKIRLHRELRKIGATKVYELTRNDYYHPILMSHIGYRIWGTRWVRDL